MAEARRRKPLLSGIPKMVVADPGSTAAVRAARVFVSSGARIVGMDDRLAVEVPCLDMGNNFWDAIESLGLHNFPAFTEGSDGA